MGQNVFNFTMNGIPILWMEKLRLWHQGLAKSPPGRASCCSCPQKPVPCSSTSWTFHSPGPGSKQRHFWAAIHRANPLSVSLLIGHVYAMHHSWCWATQPPFPLQGKDQNTGWPVHSFIISAETKSTYSLLATVPPRCQEPTRCQGLS